MLVVSAMTHPKIDGGGGHLGPLLAGIPSEMGKTGGGEGGGYRISSKCVQFPPLNALDKKQVRPKPRFDCALAFLCQFLCPRGRIRDDSVKEYETDLPF